MYWFTSDEHYWHKNIIGYCQRPFKNVHEMNTEMIKRHNEVVSPEDTTIHAGDFAFVKSKHLAYAIAERLNGKHIFLKGSHDHWQNTDDKHFDQVWEQRIDRKLVVVCHYSMRVWAASHYNSWHLYGHSHASLPPEGKSWDVGVDNNNFYPVSFDKVKEIMADRPDNFNLVDNQRY